MTKEEKRRQRQIEKARFDRRLNLTIKALAWIFFGPIMMLWEIRKWYLADLARQRQKSRDRGGWGWWFFD